jgi:hypothetical protein
VVRWGVPLGGLSERFNYLYGAKLLVDRMGVHWVLAVW